MGISQEAYNEGLRDGIVLGRESAYNEILDDPKGLIARLNETPGALADFTDRLSVAENLADRIDRVGTAR